MVNKYGIVEFAEKKYSMLMRKFIYYQNCSKRIKLFDSFIGIGNVYDGDFEFYLKAVYFLTKKW